MARASRAVDPASQATPSKRVQSSPDVVFTDIVAGLYEGRFVPGQRLVEGDLTQAYGVSRGSVREALTRLAAERIVSLSPHRGAQIRRLSRAEALDILVLLELLIGLAARLAAERIEGGDSRARFNAAFEALMAFATRSDSYSAIRARNAFYRTLVEIGRNEELARVLPGMHVHLLRVQFRALESAFERDSYPEYQAIGAAVLAGEVRKAELAGRRHVQRITKRIESLPERAFGPGR